MVYYFVTTMTMFMFRSILCGWQIGYISIYPLHIIYSDDIRHKANKVVYHRLRWQRNLNKSTHSTIDCVFVLNELCKNQTSLRNVSYLYKILERFVSFYPLHYFSIWLLIFKNKEYNLYQDSFDVSFLSYMNLENSTPCPLCGIWIFYSTVLQSKRRFSA